MIHAGIRKAVSSKIGGHPHLGISAEHQYIPAAAAVQVLRCHSAAVVVVAGNAAG